MLFETAKKPQFLLLIALFVVSALAVLITSRRRGFIVLLAAVIAFGGHILTLAHYYDSFADIAPFYLQAIAVMLYFFDGEDGKAWIRKVFAAPSLRVALSALVLICFVGGLGGVLYYTHKTPANLSQFTLEAAELLKPYISEAHDPALLFVGENPNERIKPETLQAPVRGEDTYLLAGSYDLYSPRRAALMETFDASNPLPDSVGREDIAYVLMGFPEPMTIRLASAYGIYVKDGAELVSDPTYAEKIVQLEAFTQEEMQALQDEALAQEALEREAEDRFNEIIEELIASGQVEVIDGHTHEEDEASAAASVTAAPSATVTPSATAAPSATARPSATPKPSASASPAQGNA